MKNDYYLSFAVLFQMMAVIIQQLLPLLGIMTVEQAATFRIFITLMTYLPAIVIVIKRNPILLFVTFGVYAIFLLFQYAIYPESHTFIESRQAITLTPIAIMTVIIMITIRRFDAFKKVLLWISRTIILLAIAFVLVTRYLPYRAENFTYSMSFGYSLLLPTLFLFRQSGMMDKVASFVLFLLIIADGSRGPVVVAAAYYVIHLFVFTKYLNIWKQVMAVLCVVLLAYGGLNDVVGLQKSRTTQLYLHGNFITHDSGRGELQSKVIRNIWMRPMTGWGVGSDRHIIKSYAHNLFLELSLHYGIVMTAFLTIGFIILVLQFYNQIIIDRQCDISFLIMMLLYGFVPLMVSDSYLISFNFAMMMGYLLRGT